MSMLAPNWVRLAPNGTNIGLYISLDDSECTETNHKKSHICPIWGESEPFYDPNLVSKVRGDQRFV